MASDSAKTVNKRMIARSPQWRYVNAVSPGLVACGIASQSGPASGILIRNLLRFSWCFLEQTQKPCSSLPNQSGEGAMNRRAFAASTRFLGIPCRPRCEHPSDLRCSPSLKPRISPVNDKGIEEGVAP
jgi:hypothetical protein